MTIYYAKRLNPYLGLENFVERPTVENKILTQIYIEYLNELEDEIKT